MDTEPKRAMQFPAETKSALDFVFDAALRHHGLKALDAVNTLIGAARVVDLAPLPNEDEPER